MNHGLSPDYRWSAQIPIGAAGRSLPSRDPFAFYGNDSINFGIPASSRSGETRHRRLRQHAPGRPVKIAGVMASRKRANPRAAPTAARSAHLRARHQRENAIQTLMHARSVPNMSRSALGWSVLAPLTRCRIDNGLPGE